MDSSGESGFYRYLNTGQLLSVLLPLAALIAFYGFVLRARLALGYWPHPYHPDPKDLGFVAHTYVLAVTWGLTLFLSPCGILVFGLLRGDALSSRRVVVLNVIYGILICLCISFVVFDPGRFVEWFAD